MAHKQKTGGIASKVSKFSKRPQPHFKHPVCQASFLGVYLKFYCNLL